MTLTLEQRKYGVKQYVAVVHTCRTGATFMVFETGDPKYYLFDAMNEHGVSWSHQFPVLKTDLNRNIRRALAHGWGNSVSLKAGCRNRRECQPAPVSQPTYPPFAEAPY